MLTCINQYFQTIQLLAGHYNAVYDIRYFYRL